MKILIDMQGAQSIGSRNRGIGRYTTSFVKALIRNAPDHQILLFLNDLFPETIEPLATAFRELLPSENIKIWHGSAPVSALASKAAERDINELSREAFMASLKPDVIVISSMMEGFGDDAVTSIARFANGCPTAVIHYDLIPLIYRQMYLSQDNVEIWYEQKISHLRKADILLSISEASRRDALAFLGFHESNVINISSASDDIFACRNVPEKAAGAAKNRYEIDREFILYTGGIDHRKNIETLIQAFATLPEHILKTHQLVVVCSIQPVDRSRLQSVAAQSGLQSGSIIFTGYVPEDELIVLYNSCALFVFPSLYEGFGLPVLEAMNCGAIVVASNSSNMPEVIGFEEALFDPISKESIASKLLIGLTDQGFRERFAKFSVHQVEKFSWNKTASRTLEALEELHDRSTGRPQPISSSPFGHRRARLAYVSPLPPARTGIADFSAEFLPELARHYDIEVISNQDTVKTPWLRANTPIRSIDWLLRNIDYYDRVLYHFGNSEFHSYMFELIVAIPGVVVLHDFFLSGVQAHLQYSDLKGAVFSEEIYYSHGYGALYEHCASDHQSDAAYKYPCNYTVISQSMGIITHSKHAVALCGQHYPQGMPNRWEVVPLARAVPQLPPRSEARKRLELSKDAFVICCFGMIAPTKLNDRLFKAWQVLTETVAANIQLVFVGANNESEFGNKLAEQVKSQISGHVKISGWVDQEIYRDYLAAADMAVQLRQRSRGETSAAVLDCLAAGLPTIVNANGSMAELPDDAVWKLADKFTDDELLHALRTLFEEQEKRDALSTSGKAHLINDHSPRATADEYFRIIESMYRDKSNMQFALNRAISHIDGEIGPEALIAFARATSRNFRPNGWQRQILIDVTGTLSSSLASTLSSTIRTGHSAGRIEPVYFDQTGKLRYARRHTLDELGITAISLPDDIVDYYEGDVFFHTPVSASGPLPSIPFQMKYAGVSVAPLDEALDYLSNPQP